MGRKSNKKNTETTVKKQILPSKLSINRSFNVTEGIMAARSDFSFESKLLEIENGVVRNLSVNGVFTDKAQHVANPVEGKERFFLPKDSDTLSISFTFTNVGLFNEPSANQNLENLELMNDIKKCLKKEDSVKEYLAKSYIYNILNGRIAFRNRDNAINIKSKIKLTFIKDSDLKEKELVLNFENINYRKLNVSPYINTLKENKFNEDQPALMFFEDNKNHKDLETLFTYFKESLSFESSDNNVLILDIELLYQLNKAAEVYPSQLFKEKNNSNITHYRTLSSGKEIPGLTSEKINNGIRTIDAFYSFNENYKLSLPVELTGGSKLLNEFMRKDKSIFFYLEKLFAARDIDKKENKEEDSEFGSTKINFHATFNSLELSEKFYIYAVFLRGGLLQSSNSNEDTEDKDIPNE